MKIEDAWAGGVRLGYLICSDVLSYVNGWFLWSRWSGTGTALSLAGGGLSAFPPTRWIAMAGLLAAASRTTWTFSASGARLVHEDRISYAAFYDRTTLPGRHAPRRRRSHHRRGHLNPGSRPSAPRWSISFNWGGAPGLSNQVLISAKSELKSPGIVRGFFFASARQTPVFKVRHPPPPPSTTGTRGATGTRPQTSPVRHRLHRALAIGHRLGAADARYQLATGRRGPLAVGDRGRAGDRHAVLSWAHGIAPRLPPIELKPRCPPRYRSRRAWRMRAGGSRCRQRRTATRRPAASRERRTAGTTLAACAAASAIRKLSSGEKPNCVRDNS